MKLIKSIPAYSLGRQFFPINVLTHRGKMFKFTNDFASYDSPHLFKKSLKSQPEDWHYRKKIVKYVTNSDGYRAPEWNTVDWKESVVIFGCSNVMGIGLAEDETISSQLSKISQRPVINFGAPSTAMDFSFYNSVILSENHPIPYAVIQIWTGIDRCSHFEKNSILSCGIWEQSLYFKEYVRNSYHPAVTAKMISLASKNLWKDRCRYYSASFYEDTAYYLDCAYLRIDNQARDLLHPGRENAREMAELIFKNIS